MKRTLLTLGTIAAVATPIAGVVACSSSKSDETYRGKLDKDEKIKILTLGDSVAHGDYTFQMSGSGTPFMPFLDGPARAASYQDYLFDEFQRDGLMDENDRPNYRTSASGLRSGELAAWLKPGGTYLSGVAEANAVDASATPEEKQLSKDQIEYHRHPYTQGAGTKTWWADGLVDETGKKIDMPNTVQSTPQPVAYTDVPKAQQDQVTMEDHVKDSNVVLITIGGNDILKDIKILNHQFNRMGEVKDWSEEIKNFLGTTAKKLVGLGMPEVAKAIATLPSIDKLKSLLGDAKTLQSKILGLATGKISITDLISQVVPILAPFKAALKSVPPEEIVKFTKWFLKDGHKDLIEVDGNFTKSLNDFSKNIDVISNEIHSYNPEAKIIFTGYPSPMMHFPKIFRNLAMPFYGQIANRTKEYADKTDNVYFAPSSLQNWETDDPTDIYDNILIDPHPTLEGQGAMAKDILKVIDNIYGLKAKLTEKELNAVTTDVVAAHSIPTPVMTVEERNKELKAGTYKYPYQTSPDPKLRADIDYTYNVKPLPLEELEHAKVYFGARIGAFILDAITDSIKLNPAIQTKDAPSVKHDGPPTLSDFTKEWGDAFAASKDPIFTEGIDSDFQTKVITEFESSMAKFIQTFMTKLNGLILSDNRVSQIQDVLKLIK